MKQDRDHVEVAHRISWLDVFTEDAFGGNPLAVVDAADGLSDQQMLRLARELNLSETTFVQSPSAEGADYINRIFTIEREIPFAGHPTLGTAVAVARWRGMEDVTFVQQTGAGLQQVGVARGDRFWDTSLVQIAAESGTEVDAATAVAAVGLDPSEAHPRLTPQVVSTGLPTAVVPVADAESLGRVKPDFEAIDALLADARPRAGETPNFYLISADAEAGEARARMFSTGAPGGEDPATGSAAGPLGAYLFERIGLERIRVRQGEEMGRPSRIDVLMENGRPRVSGGVVPLIDGEVDLP
jgi:trans-2,3-dihydro-3-hydroxyanthranilate isomerase